MICAMTGKSCDMDCLDPCHFVDSQPNPTPPAAPTLEQRVKSILDEMDIEQKTMTSLVHPPLAVWYGLNDPRDILEFARRLTNKPSLDT